MGKTEGVLPGIHYLLYFCSSTRNTLSFMSILESIHTSISSWSKWLPKTTPWIERVMLCQGSIFLLSLIYYLGFEVSPTEQSVLRSLFSGTWVLFLLYTVYYYVCGLFLKRKTPTT